MRDTLVDVQAPPAAPADVDSALDELGRRLEDAERARTAIEPLTASHPWLTTEHAYAIQQRTTARRQAEGHRIRGRKVGLTSAAMQAQLGVDEPDFGALLDDMLVEDGDDVPLRTLIAPRVEGEIAFVLAEDLPGPGVTSLDAARAVLGAVPALEVIDSRIADWRIGLVDTIADNASSARVVTGGRLTPLEGLDLRLLGMVVTVDGRVAATGAGAAVLGNPLRCVAWLANKLAGFGEQLHAGDLVLAGALHAALDVHPGAVVSAEVAGLGSVTTRFA